MSAEQKDIGAIIKRIYIDLGRSLGILPQIWEMRVKDFNERLGDYLGYTPETVHGYTTKTMTTELEYSQLFSALRQVMLSSVRDKESDQERAEALALEYAKLATPVLCMMAMQYSSIEFLAPATKLLTDENEMTRTLGQFMYGLWPKGLEGLSKEEADYLRECLNCYPPKCIKPKKIIDTANKMKASYGETLKSSESAAKIMNKRAQEMLKTFFEADDT